MLLQTIKDRHRQARVNRDSVSTGALSTLLGEIDTEIKKSSKPLPDHQVEELCLKMIKKHVMSLEEMAQRNATLGRDNSEVELQLTVLQSMMPEMVSDDDLKKFILDTFHGMDKSGDPRKALGFLMSRVKSEYGQRVDMAKAKSLIDATLLA